MAAPYSCAGIGRSISRVDQIDVLQRPLTMEDGGVVLMDLLWSDPTTNDGVEGVQPSPRGPGLVTFGPDRVKEFCKVRAWGHLKCSTCAEPGPNISVIHHVLLYKMLAVQLPKGNLSCPGSIVTGES